MLFSILSIALLGYACEDSKNKSKPQVYNRIISLSPSITETLFALGLGNKIVGVTSYCKYPIQAQSIAKVGGYSDANIEKILSLNPNLVVLSPEHEKQRQQLEQLKIPVFVLRYQSIDEMIQSYKEIGKFLNVSSKADSLAKLFIQEFKQPVIQDVYSPKVLISIGRDNPGSGSVGSLFSAGPKTFYNEVILAAGGTNVITDTLLTYPKISSEGVITLQPQVIFDIASPMGVNRCSLMVNDWKSLQFLNAPKKNQVFCITEDYATLPGPRLVLLKRVLQNGINPNRNKP